MKLDTLNIRKLRAIWDLKFPDEKRPSGIKAELLSAIEGRLGGDVPDDILDGSDDMAPEGLVSSKPDAEVKDHERLVKVTCIESFEWRLGRVRYQMNAKQTRRVPYGAACMFKARGVVVIH